MKRLLLRIVLLLLALAVLAAGALYVLAHRPLQLKDEVVDFTVSRGLGMRQAANVIAAAGVDVNPALLSGLARITGRATSIKAGSYEVHRGITPWQIVLKLSTATCRRPRCCWWRAGPLRRCAARSRAIPRLSPIRPG